MSPAHPPIAAPLGDVMTERLDMRLVRPVAIPPTDRRGGVEGLLFEITRGETDEILVNGPPWRTLVCVRFTDEARSPDGTLQYQNRAVLFARIVWGRIRYQDDYEDTEKVAAFDRYLAEHAGSTE